MPNFPRPQRRSKLVSVALAATVGVLAAAPAAGAHATLDLSGKNAFAGKKGTLTLTIPHGCGSNEGTVKIVMTLGRTWLSAQPTAVSGWTTAVQRVKGGNWQLSWTATDGGLPDTVSGNFPISVRWPKKAGTYSTPTLQTCVNGSQLDWKDRYVDAADGRNVYPAVYPVPRVKVYPR